jgi:predicted metal-binding protein
VSVQVAAIAESVTLHVCNGCRKRRAGIATTALLTKSARQSALLAGIQLTVTRSACLAGCHTGLTAMLETEDAVVRLQGVATAADVDQIVRHSADLLHARANAAVDGFLLSRTVWSQLED